MSASRRKGTAAETAAVDHMKANGFPYAERRALHGSADLGDVVGVPGIVVEIKNANRICIPEWMRETDLERRNALADYGVLLIKPRGVGTTRVDQWAAVLPFGDLLQLLRSAGYGDPPVGERSA